MRGRVSAVNSIFIGASNQLGEFESGATAALLGPVGSVVAGGVADGIPRSKSTIVADALGQLGSPDPSRVVMVGDRRHDVDGGRDNGCVTVAVTWGFAEEGELAAVGPDHVVHRPAELLDVLRSLG